MAIVVVAALPLGCGSVPPAATPAGSQIASAAPDSTSPTAPASGSVGVTPPTLPALDEAIPQAMAAEVELVHELQRDAGIGDMLGSDGAAVLGAVDDAQAQYAENQLPTLVRDLGIAGTTEPLASMKAVSLRQASSLQAWEPTYSGRTSFSATMLTAVLATAVGSADQTRTRSSVSSNETSEKTTGDIRERINLKTTLTLETGGGRIAGQVELVTTTQATSVSSGGRVGSLLGTARGELDVNACPDAGGIAEGSIALAWQEELTPASGASAGSAASFEAPIRMVDGDDAQLIETQLDLGFSKGAHGPGTPGGDPGAPFDWGVTGSMSVVIPAAGGASTISGLAYEDSGASDAQVGGAVTFSMIQAALIVFGVADQAEQFWRSGKCIELTPTEESREVQPQEQVGFSVSAAHRFDGAQVEGQIDPTFTGVQALDPNAPVDAPADFTFTAGDEIGDKGTIELEHISRRGIGTATLEFTVGGGLTVALDGGWRPLPANEVQVALPETILVVQDDGSYAADAEARMSGTVGIPGCTQPFNESLPLRITVRRDEADPTLARVRIDLASGDGLFRVQITCQGASTLFPIPTNLWVGSFLGASGQGVDVRIGEPTTVTGTGGSAGATTVVRLAFAK